MISWTLKRKYFPFYTKDFNLYLINMLKKKRNNFKKKTFSFVMKSFKNNKKALNYFIETSFLTFHSQNVQSKHLTLLKNQIQTTKIFNFLPLIFTLKKDLILTNINKKRQFYFLLNEIIGYFSTSTLYLLNENLILTKSIKWYLKHEIANEIFYSKYLTNIFSYNLNIFNFNSNQDLNLYTKIFTLHLNIFNAQTKPYKNLINYLNFYNKLNANIWHPNNHIRALQTNSLNKQIKRFNRSKAFYFSTSLFISRCLKNFCLHFKPLAYSPNKFIWKAMNKINFKNERLISLANKNFFIMPQNHYKFKNLIKKSRKQNANFSQIIYIMLRLEQQIQILIKNNSENTIIKRLINLYNFLNNQIKKKQNVISVNNALLSNTNEILLFKKITWQSLLISQFKTWLDFNKTDVDSNKFFNFYLKMRSKLKKPLLNTFSKHIIKINPKKYKLNYINNARNINFFNNMTPAKKTYLPQSTRAFVDKKLSFQGNHLNFTNIKKFLKILTNRNIQIFYINALALTKYAFNYERVIEKKENRSPTLFLQNIDRDLINKYKYIGIYIKDLIRICFIGMFLKKPQLIAKFLAFQISRLPRNRKETSFIRFIIKVVKTFAAEREEILGLRIKFKGRVNRWRRTKSIIGARGVVPLHTINNFIECGSAQAINRKGALGIRIWIWYKPEFGVLLKNSTLKYFSYSKNLEKKQKLISQIPFTKKIY